MNVDIYKPDGYDKHGAYFKSETLNKKMAVIELNNADSPFATNKVKQMTDKLKEAQDNLDSSTSAVETSIDRLMNKADDAQEKLKVRVSRLKDQQSQLTTALANINKTISDKQLEHLVNNTERLVTALQALEALNKSGGLGKVINAFK
jgi:predicted  nucleic acid-binding Zn-ribbon protein